MTEVWKDIKGYEGKYQVSNLGNVKSLTRKNTRGITVNGRIMKQETTKLGYKRVQFINGSRKNKSHKLVHKLVAEAFIPNPNNYPCINHKDENKKNNFVFINPYGPVDFEKSNLEWCDHQYNNTYGNRIEKMVKKHFKSVEQYDLNMNLICVYESLVEAGEKTNTFPNAISNCCNGRYKTAGGYIWKFV